MERDLMYCETVPDGPEECRADYCRNNEDEDALHQCEQCRRLFCPDHVHAIPFSPEDPDPIYVCHECAKRDADLLAEITKSLPLQ